MSIPQVLAMRVAKLSKWVKPPVIRILPFSPGPQDTKFIFDIFLQSMIACLQDGSFLPVTMPGGSHFENSLKTPRVLVKKVLVLGSGGLSIGQELSDKTGNLAEIDYSTAEALAVRTILEEGYDIRLSGQDSGQGAFSQRHALLNDQVVEGRTIVPLNQLSANNSQQGNLEIVNSLLSEYTVFKQSATEDRAAFYATDIGESIKAPRIHVNGEYPEEVSKALSLPVAFRKELTESDLINEEQISKLQSKIEEEFGAVSDDQQVQQSESQKQVLELMDLKELQKMHIQKRLQALSDKTGNLAEIDYSTAEALAFGTILQDGYDIRLSGQDSGQGTFSQRHDLLTDQVVEGRTIVPLNQLSAKNSQQGNLDIVNSPLSNNPNMKIMGSTPFHLKK
ncbi:hypothetical protein PPACK8108_LOCUS20710 [Phakopsora pachyrhizi]|uniref:Uncharacterized protein n=1 Tax=Phakopsora pachyrhizi TaxID=170000 RepID=A0AAV0BKM8_PHAPC|nr:hypothetical protein PPACK8108_LOCUS20710 [Phakopsora pachyrhizi]